MISERHERMILEEYAAAGVAPVYRSDGEIVTLGLVRKLNLLNTPATGAQRELDDSQRGQRKRLRPHWMKLPAEISPFIKRGYEKIARAAIAAMREPTDGMLLAGTAIYEVDRVWRNMIDAALK